MTASIHPLISLIKFSCKLVLSLLVFSTLPTCSHETNSSGKVGFCLLEQYFAVNSQADSIFVNVLANWADDEAMVAIQEFNSLHHADSDSKFYAIPFSGKTIYLLVTTEDMEELALAEKLFGAPSKFHRINFPPKDMDTFMPPTEFSQVEIIFNSKRGCFDRVLIRNSLYSEMIDKCTVCNSR